MRMKTRMKMSRKKGAHPRQDDSPPTSRGMRRSMWRPGQPVVVQVTRLGSGHKGPRVTARPTLPGRNVVLCPEVGGVRLSQTHGPRA